MKRVSILMICLMFGFVGMVSADEAIGVFANNNTNCLQFINPTTMQVSAPFLKGSLGSYGGGLFDVVVTPDGETAIVSNFGDSKIFFIDISGGFNGTPVLLGSCDIPFFAEDMDVTPDGKYVLVTDGGFSPYIGVVNIAGRYLVQSFYTGVHNAQAVAITPDGGMVVVADYFGGAIHSFTLSGSNLAYKQTEWIMPFRPVNIAISPDGKTVIAATAGHSILCSFLIDSLGQVCFKGPIAMPSRNGQSCVFSHDGTKAYYLSNSQNKGTQVVVLNVTAPGKVSVSGTSIVVSPMRGTSQLFGVDTIAIDPAGNYLYVANPTVSGGKTGISVIDLALNSQVDFLPAKGIPTGIAFGTTAEE